MARVRFVVQTALGLAASIVLAGAMTAAHAESFNCNQRPGQIIASYTTGSGGWTTRAPSRYAPAYGTEPRGYARERVNYPSSRHSWNGSTRW